MALGEDTDLSVNKQKIKTPSILSQAETEMKKQIDLGGMSPTDRDTVLRTQSRPYMQQLDKMTTNLNKTAEAQGLRWSSDRLNRLGEVTEEVGGAIADRVVAPLIMQDQANRRADIALGAQIGEQLFQQEFQQRQFGETRRQFDVTSQLNRDQLNETKRQFDQTFDQQASQFAQRLGFDQEQFRETVRQFNVADERQRDQFAQDLGIRREQLEETMRQFDENMKIEEQRLAETVRTNDLNEALARAEASGTYRDPVTGISSETLSQRRLKLDEMAARATAIGVWMEQGVEFNVDSVLAQLGIDLTGVVGGADGDSGNDAGDNPADEALARLTDANSEVEFIASIPDWVEQLDHGPATASIIQDVANQAGWQKTKDLLTRLNNGETISVEELGTMFPNTWMRIADMVQSHVDDNGVVHAHIASKSGLEVSYPQSAPPPSAGQAAMQRIINGANNRIPTGNWWTAENVDAIAAELANGTMRPEDLYDLPISASWKGHIMEKARGL